ncbi:MAG: translation initiation factor IF-6 [Archaeoglobaceae archaeon]|nr:translation initiation factor IF-6 [Archaeoglobaceae archaeon]MDW7989723.1 translation initiation factor IF-6 [Archaeoglobaceae archaeon]
MKLLSVRGSPLIGLYAKVSENFAVLGVQDEKFEQSLKEFLGVEVLITTISGSELVGAMISMNSNGLVVSNLVTSKELEKMKSFFDVKVINTPMSCLGNNFLVNDRGGIVHPEVPEKVVEEVSNFLNIKIIPGTVGGIKTVGMAAVVTNRGGIIHPNANDWEIKKLKNIMGIEPLKGTANFGNDMLGSSIVANSKGYLVGRDTTGYELGVIDEALLP